MNDETKRPSKISADALPITDDLIDAVYVAWCGSDDSPGGLSHAEACRLIGVAVDNFDAVRQCAPCLDVATIRARLATTFVYRWDDAKDDDVRNDIMEAAIWEAMDSLWIDELNKVAAENEPDNA